MVRPVRRGRWVAGPVVWEGFPGWKLQTRERSWRVELRQERIPVLPGPTKQFHLKRSEGSQAGLSPVRGRWVHHCIVLRSDGRELPAARTVRDCWEWWR